MSNQRSITTDPNMKAPGSELFFWDDPRKVGVEVTDADGSKYFRGPGAGTAVYLTHLRARSRDFIKGGDAIFLLTMEDVSHLTESQPLPPPTPSTPPTTTTNNGTTTAPDVCLNVQCEHDGICIEDEGKAACRCVVGNDWWYYGSSCQYKGSIQDKTNLALATSLSVLGAMLVITAVSVICVKKKYTKSKTDDSVVMANVGTA